MTNRKKRGNKGNKTLKKALTSDLRLEIEMQPDNPGEEAPNNDMTTSRTRQLERLTDPETRQEYDDQREYRDESQEKITAGDDHRHHRTSQSVSGYYRDIIRPSSQPAPRSLTDDLEIGGDRSYRWDDRDRTRDFDRKSHHGGYSRPEGEDNHRPHGGYSSRKPESSRGDTMGYSYSTPAEPEVPEDDHTRVLEEYGRRQANQIAKPGEPQPTGDLVLLMKYVQAYKAEAEKLQAENATLKSQVVSLNEVQNNWERYNREMEKLKARLDQLQAEALSSVDRFQPEFDETIIKAFEKIDVKIKPVLTLLSRQTSTLQPKDWAEEAHGLMWSGCKDRSTKPTNYAVKEMRKKALRAIVWKALEQHLFRDPFKAFDVSTAQHLNAAYEDLWKNPQNDENSTKWRSISATRLVSKCNVDEVGASDTHSDLMASLNDVFKRLGYPSLTELSDGEKKMSGVLEAAIRLAQILATQRAIFKLWEPEMAEKKVEDKTKTNVDPAYEETEEQEGKLWFLIRPGLVKWGTGKGDQLQSYTVLIKALVELA